MATNLISPITPNPTPSTPKPLYERDGFKEPMAKRPTPIPQPSSRPDPFSDFRQLDSSSSRDPTPSSHSQTPSGQIDSFELPAPDTPTGYKPLCPKALSAIDKKVVNIAEQLDLDAKFEEPTDQAPSASDGISAAAVPRQDDRAVIDPLDSRRRKTPKPKIEYLFERPILETFPSEFKDALAKTVESSSYKLSRLGVDSNLTIIKLKNSAAACAMMLSLDQEIIDPDFKEVLPVDDLFFKMG